MSRRDTPGSSLPSGPPSERSRFAREQHAEAQIESHLRSVQQELDRLIEDIRNALGVEATEETTAIDETTFDPATIANLPALLEALEAENDRVKNLSSTLTIKEIEEFADEMKTLAVNHHFELLGRWSEEMADAAGMFDLDAMSEKLQAYSRLILILRRAEIHE